MAKWIDYSRYIQSDKWQDVRSRYRHSKLQQTCYVCRGTEGPFDLHHKTYKRLGGERLNDLCRVCRPCHIKIHALAKKHGMHLWGATMKLRRVLNRQWSKDRKKLRKQRKMAARRRARLSRNPIGET